ncbi:hypothetical protein [Stakelama pacifica]|uniref:Uncharacterized protein n=1 Tax=Stakelama pacifica TaxID=517720 RepID=A0A4R6FDC9_9SPHN|nr:hypothetical protein [Stakelama pacifica]MAW99339.1 hypothetical protein [Sphingomonas sp.]MAX00297.1 hypothetical protein [Sphingomonas sp.]TDN79226.1 hypothetical protein EV664_1134 [Stakelama pacifica]GGO98681.1 hypothetical protein GCM10011329_30430 [Stakelama pacifica]
MSTESELFRNRAELDHEAAAAATLDSVRDRHLRSEAAWKAMAERSERVAEARVRNEQAKQDAQALG